MTVWTAQLSIKAGVGDVTVTGGKCAIYALLFCNDAVKLSTTFV